MNDDDVPEPLIFSIILAPFRFIWWLICWPWRQIVAHWPALGYIMQKRELDKMEINEDVGEVAEATRELERREKMEEEKLPE